MNLQFALLTDKHGAVQATTGHIDALAKDHAATTGKRRLSDYFMPEAEKLSVTH